MLLYFNAFRCIDKMFCDVCSVPPQSDGDEAGKDTFFGQEVFLTVSGQMHLEALAK